jgi:ABC-type multidrug transport system ATPase subunit/CRP-like cAMP-binding protein
VGSAFRRQFDDDEWTRLTAYGERVRLASGTVLVRRGDPPGVFYVLETGEVEVVDPRTSPPTVLGTVGPGEPIGEVSFLNRVAASADVRVLHGVRGVRFQMARLDAALREDPALDAVFHRALAYTLVGRLGRVTSSAMAGAFSRPDSWSDLDEAPVETTGDPYLASVLRPPARAARIPLERDRRIRLGSATTCDVVLDDPRVAPVHAELLYVEDDGWRVVAADQNAFVVGGDWALAAPLRDGAVLGIGRARLKRVGDVLHRLPAPPSFALHVEDIGRQIGSHQILWDIDFTVLAGEVVAMVGPSGAGKSTLMDVMSGASRPDAGRVRLGAEDLSAVLRRQPATTAEVPQDDIVLPELTVEESLHFAARMRVPGWSTAQREHAVNDLLADLGLDAVRASRIGDPAARGISGGQRKRVNIGQELLTDATRVLFLDEPTSGLDPRSSIDIARLARRLADAGRVVLLVTHDLGPTLLAEVDHLLVLAPGGRLAWFGPTEDACRHFGVATPDGIFDRLPDRSSEAWATLYAGSAMARVLALRGRLSDEGLAPFAPTAVPPDDEPVARPGWWLQLALIASRFAKVKVRDRMSTIVLLLQPLIVGVVILLVFPRGTSGLLFLLVLSCFWFGMSAAVRELIADHVVWRRERRIGLSPAAWVLAKALVIGLAVAAQCIVVTVIAHVGVGLGPLGFPLVELAATCVLTGWVGVSTGLLVSAVWRRSEAAVGTIVLLLVPQIAFSGLLMPLAEVSPPARALSWITPVRYAFHLAIREGEKLQYVYLGRWKERLVTGELFALGLRPEGVDSLGLSAVVLVLALCAFIVLQLVATIALVSRSRS